MAIAFVHVATLFLAAFAHQASAAHASRHILQEESSPDEAAPGPAGDCSSIAETAASQPALSTLLELATAAGLAETLSDAEATVTVFAPTNHAFAALGEETLSSLRNNVEELQSILNGHIVPTPARAADLSDGQTLETAAGTTLDVGVDVDTVTVTPTGGETATVTQADVAACESVVHIIDKVLVPGDGASPAPGVAPQPAPGGTVSPTPGAAPQPAPDGTLQTPGGDSIGSASDTPTPAGESPDTETVGDNGASTGAFSGGVSVLMCMAVGMQLIAA